MKETQTLRASYHEPLNRYIQEYHAKAASFGQAKQGRNQETTNSSMAEAGHTLHTFGKSTQRDNHFSNTMNTEEKLKQPEINQFEAAGALRVQDNQYTSYQHFSRRQETQFMEQKRHRQSQERLQNENKDDRDKYDKSRTPLHHINNRSHVEQRPADDSVIAAAEYKKFSTLTPTDSGRKSQPKLVGKRFKSRIKQPTPITPSHDSHEKHSGRGSSTHNRFGFKFTNEKGQERQNIKKEL